MNVRMWFVLLVVCGACHCATSETLGYSSVHKASHLVGVAGEIDEVFEQVV